MARKKTPTRFKDAQILRSQRWSFGTRPPANWSGQISHGWMGVVPLLDTRAAVSRAFQMPQHITPGLMERTVPQNKFTPSLPSLLKGCTRPSDIWLYSPNCLSPALFSLLWPSTVIPTNHAMHFELCGFTRIQSDFHWSHEMPLKMFTFRRDITF